MTKDQCNALVGQIYWHYEHGEIEQAEAKIMAVRNEALDEAIKIIGHNAIFEKRPEDWGFLTLRRDELIALRNNPVQAKPKSHV